MVSVREESNLMDNLLERYEIEDLTQTFWVEKERDNVDAWQHYLVRAESGHGEIKDFSLLAYEMVYAKERAEKEDRKLSYFPAPQPNTTLVVLVGESWEPIFQSIWAHNPQRLVPIVNEKYPNRQAESSDAKTSGSDYWAGIRHWLQKLLKQQPHGDRWNLSGDFLPQIVENSQGIQPENSFLSVKDDPDEVFRFLQEHLGRCLLDDPTCRIVVDITGAKKTMVAGAFMFAAYNNVEICYVDTERHRNGRPYGYSCCFRVVSNPMKTFFLQSWDKLGKLYDQYDFSGALNLLPEDETFPQIENLRRFLMLCHYWETRQWPLGWEIVAENLPEDLDPHVPLVVQELHKFMPQAEASELKPDLFFNPKHVVIYVHDELHRVHRLLSIKESYREAFSRAYAVYETLFKARVILLFTKSLIEVLPVIWDKESSKYVPKQANGRSIPADPTQSWYDACLKACLTMQSHSARELLKGAEQIAKWKNKRFQLSLVASDSLPSLAEGLNPGRYLREKRNAITHSYMPVAEDDVEKVVNLTQRSFDDYQAWVKWAQHPEKVVVDKKSNYFVPSWVELKQIIDLHFIPVES